MQSIAIQAYFSQMRKFFTRQGFDGKMKVVYGGDAEGPQMLLDQDLANKDMARKQGSDKDTIRSEPFTYLFWTREPLKNVVRRSINLQDTPRNSASPEKHNFKKTVSASFGMSCVLVSNKANLIEDFSEAFAAEYQNLHNVPINLKWGYEDHDTFDTEGLNITVIQDLGIEELVSFRIGNLFSYSWNITLYLNLVSEFAYWDILPLKQVVVDLYNPKGVPLASMDIDGEPEWTTHVAHDGTEIQVPERAYVSVEMPELEPAESDDGSNI